MKVANKIIQTSKIGFALILLMIGAYAGGNHLDYSFGSRGTVLTAFGSATNDFARDIAVKADGSQIVVAGSSTNDFAVVRYNADGTLDLTFDGDGKVITHFALTEEATAVAIQTDGKIVIGGRTGDQLAILRYNVDGSLDASFNGDGVLILDVFGFPDAIFALAIQPDGKIVAVGSTILNSIPQKDWLILRLQSDGTVDTTFDFDGIVTTETGGIGSAKGVVIEQDGKIAVAGTVTGPGTNGIDCRIARYNANGSLDSTFDGDGKATFNVGAYDYPEALKRTRDGKYLIAGSSGPALDLLSTTLIRLTSTGQPDTSFDADGIVTRYLTQYSDLVTDMTVQQDGKIVVTFNNISSLGERVFGLARFATNGKIDPTFGSGGQVRTFFGGPQLSVDAVAFQAGQEPSEPDKIITAGSSGAGNVYDFAVAQYFVDYAAAPGDLTGDGRADYSIFRPSTGVNWILDGAFFSNAAHQFGSNGDVPVPGDYDRDGKVDIAVFRPSDGRWYILRSSNLSYYAIPFGLSTDKPTQGDYDGDGYTDVAVFRPSTGVWYIQRSFDNQVGIIQLGTAGDKPASADFDGDGLTDIAVFRPSTGQWYLQQSKLGFFTIPFGLSGDRPVPADYDADTKADIAVWRPSNGVWYRRNSQSGFVAITYFGSNGDIPTPADFNGDGNLDLAIFRPSGGDWYVQTTSGGALFIPFGLNGDVPLLSRYIPQ